MRKEFGKWLMDIAKYIITAVIISSLFGEVEPSTIYIVGSISVFCSLSWGLLLLSDKRLKLKDFLNYIKGFFRIRRRGSNSSNNS